MVPHKFARTIVFIFLLPLPYINIYMLIATNKPIKVIGFKDSAMTSEVFHCIIEEWEGDISIISPDDFILLPDKNKYQYIVAFTLDTKMRLEIIHILDTNNYDCVTSVHPTTLLASSKRDASLAPKIGKGTCIAFNNSFYYNSEVGEHCLIEANCTISHSTVIGNNTIIHSGTMIAGKTTIGNNCTFNFRSTALNALSICDNVIVGGASTVTKNITQSGIYVGSVARRVGDYNPYAEYNNA